MQTETTTATTQDLRHELARLERQLAQAQQLAALGELTSTTAHEFNNILTTILNYAKMGLRHTDEATRTRALEKILAAGQRAERLTNGVLGLARRRGVDPVPTSLAELVAETLMLLERELQKHRIQVETNVQTTRRAHVAPAQVQQVLLNLLTNARQAMPGGGLVTISLRDDPQTGAVDLAVRDTGHGIPADVLPRIFERGFSTKQGPDSTGKGGAGIGLTACREIVETLGGRIRVESAPGKGTCFTLKLPAAAEADAPAPIQPLGVPPARATA